MPFMDLLRWIFVEIVEGAFAADDRRMVEQQLGSMPERISPVVAPILHAHVLRFRARLAVLEDREADATRSALAALDMFQQRQMPFWVAVTRLELAEWTSQHGRNPEADALLVDARASFIELGAVPWVQRVDAVTQGLGATTAQRALPA